MATHQQKLCLATPEYPPLRWGGLARTVERVAEHTANLGFAVHVAHLQVRDGPLPLLDENRSTQVRNGIKVHDILVGREHLPPGPRTLWDCPHAMTLLMMFQSLELLHAQERFDGLVSFFVYPVGYIAGLLARKAGLPHAACILGNDVRKYAFSPERAALVRSGLENADAVVALSQDLLDLAHAVTPIRERAWVIHNAVEMPPARAPRPPGRPFRYGCAAIFKYAKGLPYLLKALASLRQDPAVVLELAGELRPEEAPVFEAMLERCGLRGLVTFRGVVPPPDMPAWLAGLDAFVLPSVSEGCPTVLMEAMAAGLPCVATRVGAVADLVRDGVSGLLVAPGDSAGLAGAMSQLPAAPALCRRLGHNARLDMASFSPARERAAWQDLLERTMGG